MKRKRFNGGMFDGVAFMVLLMIVTFAVPVWGQHLDWARQHGGNANGNAIAADGDGNSYVTGYFSGDAVFGPGETNETTLQGEGMFLAGYDADGSLLWARQACGPVDGWTAGIAVDGEGNSYVTGSCSGTLLVARYDSDGTLLWGALAAGAVRGHGVAADGNGNSYVAGSFIDTAVFGSGEVHETTLTSSGSDGIFIAKYAGDGALLWVRQAVGRVAGIAVDGEGNSYVTGSHAGPFFLAKYAGDGSLLWDAQAVGPVASYGVAVDGEGNSYVTGVFNSLATFGPGEENETTLEDSHGFTGYNDDVDIFVAKYAGDGRLLWARTEYILWDMEGANGIAVDGAGNSYVTGYFSGDAIFGPGEATETALSRESGLNDVFVAGYDTDGNLLWARQAGGEGYSDYAGGEGVAADGEGNVYITGYFVGPATFGSGEINETVLTNPPDNTAIFVARYSRHTIQDLIDMIEGFDLDRGLETALTRLLHDARSRNAATFLTAFINAVEAQGGKKLTPEQAEQLAGTARQIMAEP